VNGSRIENKIAIYVLTNFYIQYLLHFFAFSHPASEVVMGGYKFAWKVFQVHLIPPTNCTVLTQILDLKIKKVINSSAVGAGDAAKQKFFLG